MNRHASMLAVYLQARQARGSVPSRRDAATGPWWRADVTREGEPLPYRAVSFAVLRRPPRALTFGDTTGSGVFAGSREPYFSLRRCSPVEVTHEVGGGLARQAQRSRDRAAAHRKRFVERLKARPPVAVKQAVRPALPEPIQRRRCEQLGIDAAIEAIAMFAELEGILLDPVYSAKGAAGLIDLIRKGQFKKGERVVFLHTGGSAALFGYSAAFDFSDRRVAAAE